MRVGSVLAVASAVVVLLVSVARGEPVIQALMGGSMLLVAAGAAVASARRAMAQVDKAEGHDAALR